MLSALFIVLLGLTAVYCDSQTENELWRILKDQYGSPYIKPDGIKGASAVNVTLGYSLLAISEVDREKGFVETVGYFYMEWKDSRLLFPELFSSVNKLNVPITDIWTPDIEIFNAFPPGTQYMTRQEIAVITEDGSVIWVPLVSNRAICKVPATGDFTCSLKFGSWTYSEDTVDLAIKWDQMDLSSFEPVHYNVVSTSVTRHVTHYDCCPEAYVNVIVTFTLSPADEE